MEPGVDENVAKATVTKDTCDSLQNDSDQPREIPKQDPDSANKRNSLYGVAKAVERKMLKLA